MSIVISFWRNGEPWPHRGRNENAFRPAFDEAAKRIPRSRAQQVLNADDLFSERGQMVFIGQKTLRAVLVLCLALGCAAPLASPQGPVQQTRNETLKGVLKNLTDVVGGMDGLTKTIGTGHKVFHDEMGNAMPPDLAQDLSRELDVLIWTRNALPVFTDLIREEQSLLDGKKTYSVADVQKKINALTGGYEEVREALAKKSSQRGDYKKRLNVALDALAATNPRKTDTYRTVSACLDPGALDNLISQQLAFLRGARDWLDAFRQQ
jgi:hypothetical protein